MRPTVSRKTNWWWTFTEAARFTGWHRIDHERSSGDRQMDQGMSRRAVMTGAAWSVPVIGLAIATPAFAASGGALSLRYGGPSRFSEGDGGTALAVWVTNLGTVPIEAGGLVVSMQEGPGFTFSGFSSLDGAWDYGPPFDGGLTFQYGMTLDPGTAGNEDDEAWVLLLYLASELPEGTQPEATANLVVTAPGFVPATISLPVPY
jgi:hypothetical protein